MCAQPIIDTYPTLIRVLRGPIATTVTLDFSGFEIIGTLVQGIWLGVLHQRAVVAHLTFDFGVARVNSRIYNLFSYLNAILCIYRMFIWIILT